MSKKKVKVFLTIFLITIFLRQIVLPFNIGIVQKAYGLEVYRQTLLAIYQKVGHHNVIHKLDKACILKQFLNLEEFGLLKWGAYVSTQTIESGATMA
mgnify:CR=1 FL=1